jgi:hypothetical protein
MEMVKLKTSSQRAHKFGSNLGLTSTLGGSGWTTSHYGRFTPRKEHPLPPFRGDFVVFRAGQKGYGEQITCPYRPSNPGP